MAQNARELFEHELKDMYDAEHKLVKALDNMAEDVQNEELSQGFKQHRQATEKQIQRLDQVFDICDIKPERQPCAGIDGLIKEYTKFVSDEKPEGPVLDVFATGAAKKVEHYEIVAYQGLIELAKQLDVQEAVRLLEQSLQEEEETAKKLEQIGQSLGKELATA